MKTNDPNKLALLESLKGGLIVSCQTQKDEPIYTEDMVVKMAECAKWGGAVGLRLNSPEQIRKVKEANLGLPIIGLYKVWHEDTDVFITPTMKEVDEIVAPTLYGYTKETAHIEGADFRMVAHMCRELQDEACVIMEGHIYSPEDAMKCIFIGCHSVVVGSAITRPHYVTKRFVDCLGKYQNNWRDAERAKHANELK